MEKVNLLFEEYKLSTQRIEDYQEKHLSFYKSILLVLTGLIFFYDTERSPEIKNYLFVLPYILLTLFVLIHYHYHRTLIVQGHRKALEEIINDKEEDKKFPLQFGTMSQRFIITAGGNPGIILFGLINLVGMIYLIIFCNQNLCTTRHQYIQGILAFVILVLFVFSTIFAEKASNEFYTLTYNGTNPDEVNGYSSFKAILHFLKNKKFNTNKIKKNDTDPENKEGIKQNPLPEETKSVEEKDE